jgi:hypothetical protein
MSTNLVSMGRRLKEQCRQARLRFWPRSLPSFPSPQVRQR